MASQPDFPPQRTGNEFETAGRARQLSLAEEFLVLMKQNKKWWLTPILLVFALVGLLVILGSTGAAPFIYTMF